MINFNFISSIHVTTEGIQYVVRLCLINIFILLQLVIELHSYYIDELVIKLVIILTYEYFIRFIHSNFSSLSKTGFVNKIFFDLSLVRAFDDLYVKVLLMSSVFGRMSSVLVLNWLGSLFAQSN